MRERLVNTANTVLALSVYDLGYLLLSSMIAAIVLLDAWPWVVNILIQF